MSEIISWADFQKVEIRVGRIVDVQDFPKARVPSYQIMVDLGTELGTKKSSAHLTKNYTKEQLLGRLVLCVANFPPKQVANIMSEILILGVPDQAGEPILIGVDKEVPLGGRLF
ncbi:MAG: tRNA-binding protein [Oligoflexia bacterium]|nr:tRNA-binding protein [Oligoflexia bacterium]